MSALQQSLQFIVSLTDQVTRPLRGIDQQIQRVTRSARQGWMNVGVGAAGLAGTGMALRQTLDPAIQMDRALGEVASLGVAKEGLDKLSQTALQFSVDYGKSAVDTVRAAYDIQSAIGGLSGDELSRFTRASGVLAAATKADTGTITSYMGTMYGIFKQNAEQMGKANWVEQTAGMTALAVQMFKTTGQGMADAFKSIGANATTQGIGMAEQMAIMGQLQATMSGAEAGTKYKSFLAGAANAQKTLGLQFTDSQGRMLPMLDILGKLKQRYGDTMSLMESDELKKAFGSDEAVSLINALMTDTAGLAANIDLLGKTTGMGQAEKMAGAMTDQWERLESAWFAIRAAGMGVLLPSINEIVGSMADAGKTMLRWTGLFPNLTKLVGYAVLGLGGMAAAMAVWSILAGGAGMITGIWGIAMMTLKGIMMVLRTGLLLTQGAIWLFNSALWANPVTWVVVGIIALIAVIAAAIYYWDDIKKAFMDSAVFKVLAGIFDKLAAGWDAFMDLLGNLNPIKMLGSAIDWLIDKLNLIPGIHIDTTTGAISQVPEEMAAVSAPINQYRQQNAGPAAPVGGLGRQLVQMNAAAAKPGKTNNFGDVHIHSDKGMTPDQLSEWSLMQTP